MQKSKKSALILVSSLVSIAANADNSAMSYSYLSGGAAYDKSGWNTPLADFFGKGTGNIVDISAHPKALTSKRSSFGGYLHGSYALDDHLFLKAELGYLSGRKNGYFVGVGYRVQASSRSDVYIVGGISQPKLPAKVQFSQQGKALGKDYCRKLTVDLSNLIISDVKPYVQSIGWHDGETVMRHVAFELHKMTNPAMYPTLPSETIRDYIKRYGINEDEFMAKMEPIIQDSLDSRLEKTVNESEISLKSKIAPTLEIGYQITVNDQLSGKVAYRSSYDSVRMQGKLFNPLSEEMTTINYKKRGLSHEGTVEANYAFTPNLLAEAGYTLSKMFKIEEVKPKTGHRFTLGLRYVF